MKQLNIFNKFIYSIIDIKSYLVFLREKTANGILYILLLSIVFGGIKGYGAAGEVKTYFNNARTYIEQNKSNFKLQNGKMTIGDKAILKEDGNTLLFIDTSYDYSQYDQKKLAQLNLENYLTSTLIFRDMMIINNNGKQTVEKFSDFNFNIDADMAISLLSSTNIVSAALITIIVLQGFIGNLLLAVILAVTGLASAYWLKSKIRFKGLYRISLYALTLPIIMDMVLFLLKVSVPFFDIIYFVIALTYVQKAIKLINTEVSEEELFIIG
ncbi:MAG: DUF1189 domain-containing protein [Clostridiaceae bacterium]